MIETISFETTSLRHAHLFVDDPLSGAAFSPRERSVVDPGNEVIFSAVVAWEIAVKRARGKLGFGRSPKSAAERLGLTELSISALHCEAAAALAPHHRDPFDRLLVAQAEIEGLVLVSSDAMLARYEIPMLKN